MTKGSCFCGAVTIEYTGEVQARALCHCADCKKMSGSTYSTNIIVPGQGFTVSSGKAKEYTKTADSGNNVTSHFCGDCGTTLFRTSPTFGESKVIKVGVLDDPSALDDAKPDVELYAEQRTHWVEKHAHADQKKAMPNSESISV